MGGAVIAALYVDPDGTYSGRPDVEPWGLPARDAREYAGPWPVVAHPPCQRWGKLPPAPLDTSTPDPGFRIERMCKAERERSPAAFAAYLISLAASARPGSVQP